MPDEQPTSEGPAALRDAANVHEPLEEQDAWPEESEELPPRPRRRMLTPLPLALLAALAIACGFIAGVLVEKGQSGSTSATGAGGGAFASRLAALRGGTGSSAGGPAATSGSSLGSGSAATGTASGSLGVAGAGSGGSDGSDGSATVGQVAYADKGTLYVTTSEGNTVKVTAAAGAGVTKTVKTSIEAIHPGETVLVAGSSGPNGAISASSIRVGSAGGGLGGGASALFGAGRSAAGAGGGASSSGASSGAAQSGASEPQLFGKG
jgi:hypothetical protein